MGRAASYVPIFDPAVHTFESLCHRSPFAITALITIGSKIEDAGGPQSELQIKCREHAEDIGRFMNVRAASDSRQAHPVHAGLPYGGCSGNECVFVPYSSSRQSSCRLGEILAGAPEVSF